MKSPEEKRTMLSVEEGKRLVAGHVTTLPVVKASLEQALLKVLAADIVSPVSIPAFNQSAMDGYAFDFAGSTKHAGLEIAGEVAAGASTPLSIKPHQAARIFTGAPMPAGADTVVMQEKVAVQGNRVFIKDEEIRLGSNVRPAGSEIKKNDPALSQGTLLTPGAAGYMAAMGIHTVKIIPAPRVSIIITGNELQTPGEPLRFGQVYESNSYTLRTALQQLHITDITISRVEDDIEKLKAAINSALETADTILLTGGVSVGNYDYVTKALSECGVMHLFHKLKQKPGKPLYFGKREGQVVFGLPGNPASVLTCFYEYVYPALRRQMGFASPEMPIIELPLLDGYVKKAGLTHFLKGMVKGGGVSILQAQESYRMQTFATSNCLIMLPEESTVFLSGDQVEVHVLPI